MSDRMKQRAGTSAQWAASTVALLDNELGYDTDLKRVKRGDGTSLWAELAWEPIGLTIGRTIDDAAIAADASCLNITADDYGAQITFAATTAQNLTVVADITSHTEVPVVQIYLAHATAFPTVIAQSGGTGDMRVYAPSGATGLEQYGYMALQMNSQAAPYPGGDWRVDVSAAGVLAANALNSATTTIDVSGSAAPIAGQVLTAVDPTHAAWQTPEAIPTGEVLLQSYNIPIILPPTGTVAADGTLGFDVSLPEAYADGGWMYHPADVLKAGLPAALRWYVGSSTIVGTLYQNTYTPGTDLPNRPATLIPFTDLTPGPVAGTASVNVVPYSVTKPANALGNNGSIKIEAFARMTNSANVKSYIQKYGGATLFTTTTPQLTSTVSRAMQALIQNCGSQNSQRGYASWVGSTFGPVIAASTIDDASAQTISCEISKSTALEAMVLQRWDVRVEKVN